MAITDTDAFAAKNLLSSLKSCVKDTSAAITETSTPEVREVLTKQLNQLIQAHARVFYYLLSRGLYPSYDLEKMIQNDLQRIG